MTSVTALAQLMNQLFGDQAMQEAVTLHCNARRYGKADPALTVIAVAVVLCSGNFGKIPDQTAEQDRPTD